MAKKKKANKISPFVGWSVSLAQNSKKNTAPKKWRKEYYNPVPGHAAYTGTKSTRTAVRQLYTQLRKSPVAKKSGIPQAKSWKQYSRYWNPRDVTGSMDKVAANYETADELSKFMYTILRASQGQSTELLDDARDGKIDEERPKQPQQKSGNPLKDLMGLDPQMKFKKKYDDDDDNTGFFGDLKDKTGDYLHEVNKVAKHLPGVGLVEDVADQDYFREGMEKALDVVSRPLFAVGEATRQMNRKDKDGRRKLGITGTDPVSLVRDVVRTGMGQDPVDALDDMKPKDYGDVIKGAWRGFTGKEKTTGARIIADSASRDNHTNIYDKRAYQIAAGLTYDLTADPLNFVGVGVVRAPVKAKRALEDKKVYNLAKQLADSEIPKPGTNTLYSPNELYHALGGSSTKRSGLQKSQSLERSIETIDHVKSHLKQPLVATNKGLNARAHKLYNLERRGKRAVAKRDKQLESFLNDYETGKLSAVESHQMDIINEEARRSVAKMVSDGSLPKGDEVDDVMRVANVKSAISQERFFRRKSKALEQEQLRLVSLRKADDGSEASLKRLHDQEGKVAAAQNKLLAQQDLHRALGPAWSNNPLLPEDFRAGILDDLPNLKDPKYRAARSRAGKLSGDVKQLETTVSRMYSNNAPASEIKKAEAKLSSLKGESQRAWEHANTVEASLFTRRVDHFMQNNGKPTFTNEARGQELVEEQQRILDELADSPDESYTGMLPEDYQTKLADEVSDYDGGEEVPFGRHADLQQRLRHLTGRTYDEVLQGKEPTPDSALGQVTVRATPLEAEQIGTPEGFSLTEPSGELSAAAKEHIDFADNRFTAEEGAPEWAGKLATVLNDKYRKALQSKVDSTLRATRADRKNVREASNLTETRQMFGAPEGSKTDLVGMVRDSNGEPVYAGRYSDDLVTDGDTRVHTTFDNHLTLSKENFDKGADVSPILKKKAKTLYQILRGLNFHAPVGTDDFVKWAMDDVNFPKIQEALSPQSIAFVREFRKQHGVSYADALVKRDKELGKVVKWHDKSRYKGQALTKQESLDMLMSGKEDDLRHVLLGNGLDFRVPGNKDLMPKGGSYRQWEQLAKSKGLSKAQAESSFLAAAKGMIKSEPQEAVKVLSRAWNDAYRRQLRGTTAPAEKVKATAIDYEALDPNVKMEYEKATRRQVLADVDQSIKAGNLTHKSPEFSKAKLMPSGQADARAIRAALREKQAEQIAEAKLIPNLAERNAQIKTLRENHVREKAAYDEAFEKAANSRKLMQKRLDEDMLLRLINADVQAPGSRLSVQTWGDTDLFAVPGSQTLFNAANKLGNIPIIKQTRQVFADAFRSPSDMLPRELNIARNRALGNTPQIIAQHIKELKAGLGAFHESERISSFNGWKEGAKVGGAGDSIDALFNDLLPYFKLEKKIGADQQPVTIGEINRYLPSHLQVKLKGNRLPQTGQQLVRAMEAGGAHARKLAGTRREVKKFPKDPMDIVWETRVAVEQAVARKALIDVVNSFGVRRKQHLENGKLVAVPNHELVEELGSKHGWQSVDGLDNTHYFPPESMDDIQNLLDLMEPHNITSFGRLVDEVTGAWKTGATTYNPGYYTRNGMGEMMSSWFDGVKTAKPYRRAMHMGRYMRHEGKELEALKSHMPALDYVPSTSQSDIAKKTAAVLRNGHKVNIEEATVLYFDQGLKTGFFNTEREVGTKFGRLAQKFREGAVTGKVTKGHEGLRNVGENWEDHFRMAHFLDAMEKAPKGFNATQAAEFAADKVRRYHFDYTDFTQFEKTVMLRVFPFYKWTRKAAPLMMTMLFTKPGKAMAYPKVMNSISQGVSSNDLTEADPNGFMPNYEGIVPEWMRDMWTYKIDEEENGDETFFKMATPQMDIYSQMGNPAGTASMLTNPLIKVPYEQATGESFPGGGMDLKIDDNEKRIDELMRQLPATSMLNKELEGRGNDQTRASYASGLGFYKSDEESKRMEMLAQGMLGTEQKEPTSNADTKKGPSSQQRMAQLVDTVLRAAFREEKAKEGKEPTKEEEDKWVAQGFKGMDIPLKAQYRVSSEFGPRTHPINGSSSNHTGIDLAADGGSAVYAPNDGTVVFSGWDDVYGNKIIVDFGHGQKAMFGHLDSSKVNYGQKVRKGDSIGYVGSTGLSSGPHLHWETWEGDTPINPQQFLGG